MLSNRPVLTGSCSCIFRSNHLHEKSGLKPLRIQVLSVRNIYENKSCDTWKHIECKRDFLKKEIINNRDKTVSLLTLALDKKTGSRCPSAEVLASFLDGKCSVVEKKRVLSHLADCDHCYTLWYSLKTASQKKRTEGIIYYLIRPKNLAVAGSALAIAASVVIFMNIAREPLVGRMKEKTAVTVETVDERKSNAPIPAQIGQVEEEFDDGELKVLSAPAPALLKMGDLSVSPVQTWLASVETACREGRQEEKFWKEQFFQGKKMVSGAGAEDELFRAVLMLLPGKYDQITVEKRCKKILERLAREKERR